MQPKSKTPLVVRNATRGTSLCSQAALAETSLERLFGLLGKRSIQAGGGLLIKPSSGVHTWGMRFPIDIVALDRDNHVVGSWSAVTAWRIRGLSFKTRSVLELGAGVITQSGTQIGDTLCITGTTIVDSASV